MSVYKSQETGDILGVRVHVVWFHNHILEYDQVTVIGVLLRQASGIFCEPQSLTYHLPQTTTPTSQKKRKEKAIKMKRYLRIYQHGNEIPRFINRTCQTGDLTQRITSVDGLSNKRCIIFIDRFDQDLCARQEKETLKKSNMPNRRDPRRGGLMGIQEAIPNDPG